MGGGPSREQKDAAASQKAVNYESIAQGREENSRRSAAFNTVFPDIQKSLAGSPELIARSRGAGLGYLSERAQNGNPYYSNQIDFENGNTARSAAPARAEMYRRLGPQNLPSGAREANLREYDLGLARAFDDNLVGAQREQAATKFGAAQQLDSEELNALLQNEQFKNQIRSMLMGQQQISSPVPYFGVASQGNASIMNAPLAKPGLAGLIGAGLGAAATAYAGR